MLAFKNSTKEYKKWIASFEKEQAQERIQKHEKQEEQITLLFENGFVTPVSSKINTKADIACWINYEAIYGRMSSFYYLLGSINSNREVNNSKNAIKGMNVDFYFENNKARMEQKVEYSESLANVMQKVVARKPNKNIFNYFPKQEPLAYFSYHSSTEELLKNYPEIILFIHSLNSIKSFRCKRGNVCKEKISNPGKLIRWSPP